VDRHGVGEHARILGTTATAQSNNVKTDHGEPDDRSIRANASDDESG
jgi:hypothetical protein